MFANLLLFIGTLNFNKLKNLNVTPNRDEKQALN